MKRQNREDQIDVVMFFFEENNILPRQNHGFYICGVYMSRFTTIVSSFQKYYTQRKISD